MVAGRRPLNATSRAVCAVPGKVFSHRQCTPTVATLAAIFVVTHAALLLIA